MGIQFTESQQLVIDSRHENILVSAAAGSGKTAVLVERIIQMISREKDPVDIDRLLIVTFTKAAASEMRERISNGIGERLAKHPENQHLQRQSALLHNAQITTIDSFCLFVIRNHFQEIGLDPAFRVADEGEVKLLMQDAMEEVLEEAYSEKKESFCKLVEGYCPGKKDTFLEEQMKDLYRFAMSYPWPEKWLLQHKMDYHVQSKEELLGSDLIRYLEDYLKQIFEECRNQMTLCHQICLQPDGPYMYAENVENTLSQVEKLCEMDSYEAYSQAINNVTFERLPSKKDESVSAEKRNWAQTIRNQVKEQLKKIQERFFMQSIEGIWNQMNKMDSIVQELVDLTLLFAKRFEEKKRDKNLLDFTDMEHLALQILCQEEDGRIVATAAAKDLRNYFVEIMVDEYQDSNLVQECILSCISGEEDGHFNRFMVGDVKQSIYKFRLARPELFMEKYLTYDTKPGNHHRIDLSRNFRSRKQVIDSVNLIFEQLMAPDLGKIAYDESARLYCGASYPEENVVEGDFATEFLMLQPDTESEEKDAMQEARMIAGRIRKLLREQKVTDKETGELRLASYGDIVVLIRGGADYEDALKDALEERHIPCFVTSKTGYFQTKEITQIMQILRVLDNPLQDIPCYGTMVSAFGGFQEEEIAAIVAASPDTRYLYRKVEQYIITGDIESGIGESSAQNHVEGIQKDNIKDSIKGHTETKDAALVQKCRDFLEHIKEYRSYVPYLSISELLEKLLEEMHYLEYVTASPDGMQRRANVQLLLEKASTFEQTSFKGLYHFIRYIDQIEKSNVEYGEANVLDENADVVRIMTIHKSKGLEFPICIVAGMGKSLNRQDSRKAILTDIDMGIGADYVDSDLRMKRKTLRKNIMARKILLDSQAEELRVLYVALTRAKEKLIISGVVDNLEKKIEDTISVMNSGEVILPYSIRTDAGSFMDLIFAALLRTPSMQPLLHRYGYGINPLPGLSADISCQLVQSSDVDEEDLLQDVHEVFEWEQFKKDLITGVTDENMTEDLQNRFEYVYPYENLQELHSKTSVSELKMAAIHNREDQGEAKLFEESIPLPYLPSFLKEEEKVSGAVRGSAMHRIMELIEFQKEYSPDELKRYLLILTQSGKMSAEYADAVQQKKVLHFLQTDLAGRMQLADRENRLYREQPFVLGLSANRVKEEFPEEENVLIQGIIDVFFYEEDEIVLLDYKTDVVDSEKELVDRYKVQLDYYKEALERITGKRVKQVLIYSFYFEKEIMVE